MKKQVLFLLAIMLNCSIVLGQNIFNNTNANGAYGEEDNWSGGYVPDGFDQVIFDANTTADNCIITDYQENGWLEVGVGGVAYGSVIIKNGGHLEGKTAHWTGIGWDAEATLVVEAGGIFTVAEHLWLGFNAASNSHVQVYGTVNVAGMYGQNFINNADSKSDVTVYNGGVMNLSQWHAGGDGLRGANHILNIMGGGQIIIVGDHTEILATQIASNNLVAPGGSVTVAYDIDTDKTTITSTADPIALGIKELATLDFNLYPNPTTDVINVNSKTAISNVKVYNILGKLVKDVNKESRIDISDLSAGYYVVKIQDDLGSLGVTKLIKK
jgi:hypothetical protein